MAHTSGLLILNIYFPLEVTVPCWPWLIEREQRATKTRREGERNWDGDRDGGEKPSPRARSSSCYFNPDSALKYGHHVDPLKKCGSAVGPANRRRRAGPGGGTWGGSGESEYEGGIKVWAEEESQGREVTSPGELDYPQTNGDRLGLLSHFA